MDFLSTTLTTRRASPRTDTQTGWSRAARASTCYWRSYALHSSHTSLTWSAGIRFCIINDGFCIINDRFVIKMMNCVLKMMNFVLNMMIFGSAASWCLALTCSPRRHSSTGRSQMVRQVVFDTKFLVFDTKFIICDKINSSFLIQSYHFVLKMRIFVQKWSDVPTSVDQHIRKWWILC